MGKAIGGLLRILNEAKTNLSLTSYQISNFPMCDEILWDYYKKMD